MMASLHNRELIVAEQKTTPVETGVKFFTDDWAEPAHEDLTPAHIVNNAIAMAHAAIT